MAPLIRFFALATSTLLLFTVMGCATYPSSSASRPHTMGIHQIGIPVSGKVALKPFNTIDTHGFFDVNITTGKQVYQVEVVGDKAIVEQVVLKVKNRALHISMPPDLNFYDTGPVAVNVEMPTLNHLYYSGTGNVTGNIPNNRALTVDAHGSGNVKLLGEICLKRLTQSGSNNVTVYWINSPGLSVNSEGKSEAFLAGKVDQLDVTLYQSAHLNARYLRAERAYINTTKNSVAEVSVTDSLNALASGNSNIYYFRNPRYIAPYMRDNGAVLPMYR